MTKVSLLIDFFHIEKLQNKQLSFEMEGSKFEKKTFQVS